MNTLRRIALIALLAVPLLSSAADSTPAMISPDALVSRLQKPDPSLVILDVRTPEEFAAGHIPGALNIPHDQLPNRLAELAGAQDKELVVYCRSGRRSAIAQEELNARGFKSVKHLEGDMLQWDAEKRPIAK